MQRTKYLIGNKYTNIVQVLYYKFKNKKYERKKECYIKDLMQDLM